MASPDAALRLDEQDRITFAHSPWSALGFLLISLALAWLCWNFIQDNNLIRNGFTGFALLFVAAGVFGIFWRMEMDIDLTWRRVRLRRGFWPSPKISERPLDEADGIHLTLEYRSAGSKGKKRKVPWWLVSLKFPDEKKGTRIFVSRNERDAYEKWEYFARRLELDAVDATSAEPARQDWRRLDDNLAARTDDAGTALVRAPTMPAGSTIEVLQGDARKELILPRLGFNGGLVFLAFFGAAFIALGGGGLLASLGVIDMEVQGSRWAILIVPPVFVLAGLGIVWLGIWGSFSSLVVGVGSAALYTENLAFGRRSGRKSVPLAEIESITVGGDVRSRRRTGARVTVGGVSLGRKKYREREDEIVIRSDNQILRFGGSLPEADKTWLADACRYASVRGQLP